MKDSPQLSAGSFNEEWVDYENLPEGDGVIVVSPESWILSANLQAERVLKRRVAPGERFDLTSLVTEHHRPNAEMVLIEAIEGGHSHTNLIFEISQTSGPPISLICSINPLHDRKRKLIGLVLTMREKQPDRQAAEGKASRFLEYDVLFENLAEGIFTIDNRWRITAFNQRAQEITGVAREEALGKFCWDIFKSDFCRSNCPLKITMETGIVCMDQDVRIFIKGKRQQSILVNTSVIRNKRGLVVGAVETFRPFSTPDQGEARAWNHQKEIIGESGALSRILSLLPDLAASDATVLIEGASGTGKELIAKAIHLQSPRASGPFIPVNCSALAETLLESELFGHVKGAFTGAVGAKVGRFELARGGTLFLDEIGEIKPDTQVKLLRVIEERVFERVGGNRSIAMDARIIAATNKNLKEEVREKRFREDLYYRLRTVPLALPSLKERTGDIPLLVNHFVARFNAKYGKKVRGVDLKVLSLFKRYSWPGNVRELERVVEHAFVFVKGPLIKPSHLPDLMDSPSSPKSREFGSAAERDWGDERATIQRVLEESRGKRDEAARLLGISRTSLWRKMKSHGLV